MEKNSVFEYEIIKINNEYSAITITHQDEEIFKRGIFTDIELNVFSRSNPALGISGVLIRGSYSGLDLKPIVAENCVIESISKTLEALKNKYNKKYELEDFLKENLILKEFSKFERNCYLQYFGVANWKYEVRFLNSKPYLSCISYENAKKIIKVLNEKKITFDDFNLIITKLGILPQEIVG